MGGQAHVPSFIRTSILNFISRDKEFYRADFAVFFSRHRRVSLGIKITPAKKWSFS
jgi:hypothetical protein